MHDVYSGIDTDSFAVTADFAVNGAEPGTNLASQFVANSDGVWELKLKKPIEALAEAKLLVSVKDRAGNTTRIERSLFVRR